MKIKSSSKKILIAICAILLTVAIVLAVVLPGMLQKDINNYSYVAKKQTGVKYSSEYDITLKGKVFVLRESLNGITHSIGALRSNNRYIDIIHLSGDGKAKEGH